ncbi:CAAX prenyl protease 2 [Galendromus occidentalis]|uniref:CAAX prenyl protease 2 n=1 Tax=Galendromus occidentalis TaxID=34638 RepID=A0AAJ7L590_9ACAR|nr:CAAX prenyl protease 2 [Galendromus occidentalis]
MLQALACAVGIALAFLVVIYVGIDGRQRNEPSVAKLRCVRVLLLSLITPVFVYFVHDASFYSVSFRELLGIRADGLLPASVLPLALTMLFYLAPIVTHFVLDRYYTLLIEPHFWKESLTDPLWVRDHICAPFVEEVCFRACLLPLLYPHFGGLGSAIVGPVLFGLCHLHHVVERVPRFGLLNAVKVTASQLLVTTLFGIYTSFLFLRTGHILPCILVHAFCNYMGVPQLPAAERSWLWLLYAFGIAGWCFLLRPLTDPDLYSNSIFIN